MKQGADYHLSTSTEDKIAIFVVTGSVTKESMNSLRAEGLAFLRESRAEAVLWNIRATKTYPEIAEAYFRVRNVPQDFRRVPTAIVDETRNHEFESFFETTAQNAGLTVRFFADLDTAKVWLKSKILWAKRE